MKKLFVLIALCLSLSHLMYAQKAGAPAKLDITNARKHVDKMDALMNPGGSPGHQTLNKTESLVKLYDSIYFWQWDTLLQRWKTNPYSKEIGFTYDVRNNLTGYFGQTWNGTAWINDFKDILTYNVNNNNTSYTTEIWNGTTWENNSRSTYTYDANNNYTSYTSEIWNGTSWEGNYRVTYTYDANNNMTSSVQENWNGTAWENSYKSISTYDANKNKISEISQTWSGTAWENDIKRISTYNASYKITEELQQNWNGTAWKDAAKQTYSYDANMNLISSVYQVWNGAWENFYKDTYTYDVNNNNTSYLWQRWIGSWLNFRLNTYTYDANNNRTGYLSQDWDGTAWINSTRRTSIYDANNFVRYRTFFDLDVTGTKIVYGDSTYYYYHTGLSGINNQVVNQGNINIYPNPFNNHATICFPSEIKSGTLKLIDMLGKEVRSISFSGTQFILEKGDMNEGIYFVEVNDENKIVATRKVIVQ